jgi:Fe-S cluster assembly protein SufD
MGAKDPAIALNTAFMQGGIVLDIEPGAAIDMPVEIVSIATEAREQAFYSRSLVRLGAGARLNLTETQVSVGGMLSQKNDMLIVMLGDDAVLDHTVTVPRNAPGSVQVSSLLARLSARSNFSSFALVSDAAFLRRQTFLRFDGEHASAVLSGVSILGRHEHADTTLVVEHVAPNCKSREAFKHIIDDEATGVFQGRIVVAPGAQKTDGGMSSRAILLSEGAAMYNKPELEIFADDVVCGHGATCGELDEDLLFYAMSRGLPRDAAESLLLEAFAGEVVDAIANETLRESLMDRVRARLSARRSS